jgi:hypothetical protein
MHVSLTIRYTMAFYYELDTTIIRIAAYED